MLGELCLRVSYLYFNAERAEGSRSRGEVRGWK